MTNLKIVLFCCIVLALSVSPVKLKAQLKNLDYANHQYASYIQDLVDSGIVSGYSDGTFKPENTITRGELTKFIVNSFTNLPNQSCPQFEDVNEKNTFYNDILKLKCNKVVSGVFENKFFPENNISRAETIKIIINTARTLNSEIFPNFYYTQFFKDVEIKNQFYEVIMSAFSHQIAEGQKDVDFNPDQAITRGEVSRMISIAKKMQNAPVVVRQKTTQGVKFNTLGDFWAIEVNLEKGGKVDFATGKIVDFGVGKGVFGGNDPSFERNSLENYWTENQKNNPNLFAIFNGSYFRDNSNSATEIALPLVVRGEVATDGYASTTEFIGQKEILQIFNKEASIVPFDENNPFENITAPNAIVSFIEQNPRSSSSKVGRVYAGISDKDKNGSNETIYFLFSKNATQAKMRIIMNYLGVKKMTMLDGGGSTQLIVDSEKIIESGRTIPQVVLISSKDPLIK
jgi:hypothetical protein